MYDSRHITFLKARENISFLKSYSYSFLKYIFLIIKNREIPDYVNIQCPWIIFNYIWVQQTYYVIILK